MPRPRVYVETTIPSYYHEQRSAPEVVAMRNWTRAWWVSAAERYELVTSLAVLNELLAGPSDRRRQWLELLSGLPILPFNAAVLDIAATYGRQRLMPARSGADALHLAFASFHECDLLVTWNLKHLANANKFDDIRRVNSMLGLFVPKIATPLDLLEKEP
jgi:predicted nucleic acid-binding protein